jgi:hypothetical protein
MLLRVPRVTRNSSSPKKTIAIERFWLCGECAETMTLEIDRRRTVKVIPVLSVHDADLSQKSNASLICELLTELPAYWKGGR